MRSSLNPYGGVSPLIDKMIGNAYDIVKYVAKYLKEIRYVAENMALVYTAVNGNRTEFEVTADGTGDSVVIALPVDLDYTQVKSVSVLAYYATDNTITFPSATTFEFAITDGSLTITLISADASVVSGTFRAVIIHDTPTE